MITLVAPLRRCEILCRVSDCLCPTGAGMLGGDIHSLRNTADPFHPFAEAMRTRLSLHTSFSELLEKLMPRVSEGLAGIGEGIEPMNLVVPSTLFADWLQLQFAARLGVCMGIEFLKPQEFVRRSLSAVLEQDTKAAADPWEQENLRWRILPRIRRFAGRMGVRHAESLPPRESFALASLIADRFDQYGHFRPEMIESWAADRPAEVQAEASDITLNSEAWQRELWRELRAEIETLPSPSQHPALAIAEFATRLRSQKGKTPLQRVTVVGSGMLDPVLVNILGILSEAGGDVEIYSVLPSLGYLAELKRGQAWEGLLADPEAEAEDFGNPLAASLGRQSIGAFQLLGRLDEDYSAWPETGALRQGNDKNQTLLSRIQEDVRQSLAPKPQGAPFNPADQSLRVHSCHSPRRELEVLRDELLRAFATMDDLKPEDVLIVSSDLATYAPLVSPLLAQGTPPLPVRLTQVPQCTADPQTEGLLALLDYALTRQAASGLLALLDLRSVQSRLGLEDRTEALQRLRLWVRRSGLTFGRDAGHRKSLGVGEDDTGTWRFSMDRMLAGDWLGDEPLATDSKGDFVLPLAGELLGDESLRRDFSVWVEELSCTFEAWEQAVPPPEWAERLDRARRLLLRPKEAGAGSDQVQDLLQHLRDCPCVQELDVATIRDWLSDSSALAVSRRSAISGQIAFGKLNQLHSLPCRVLAMVGMQDAAFPRQNRNPSWDLLQLKPERWDRNLREEDRQCFLDCVMAPTERLIITASNRNSRTNKEEALSSCVDELLRIAGHTLSFDTGGARGRLLCVHALSPANRAYFDGGDTLPQSFHAASAQVASELAKGSQERCGIPLFAPGDRLPEPTTPEEGIDLPLEALIDFWKNPARAFLRARGIAIPRDEDDDLELDLAPISVDALQSWKIKDQIVHAELTGSGSADQLKALFTADRGLPPSQLGDGAWNQRRDRALEMASVIRTRAKDRRVHVLSIEDCPGVKIHGKVELCTDAQGNCAMLHWRAGTFGAKPKHLTAPWIRALALSACEKEHPVLLVDEDTGDGEIREIDAIPSDQAKVRLGHLIRGYLEGQTKPLAYAPNISAKIAKAAKAGAEVDFASIAEAWSLAYETDPGEGTEAAAVLAWRDLDPFDPKRENDWLHWAREIAQNLHEWMTGKGAKP